MQFITPPMCGACGLPLSYAPAEGMLCGTCLENRPLFSAARAVFRFDDHSKTLIHQLKFQDELYLAKTFAVWLARAGAELVARSDVIVPVPLHRRRLVARRYNQSAQLAYALGRHCDLPCMMDGLIKLRHTVPQSGLTRKERETNVRRAFGVNPARQTALAGKTVLLVDDVLTTGATANACAAVLQAADVCSTQVLTLARVSRD